MPETCQIDGLKTYLWEAKNAILRTVLGNFMESVYVLIYEKLLTITFFSFKIKMNF